MMAVQLPDAGAASLELARKAHQWWMESATKEGLDLSTFDPAAPLPVRLAWAQSCGLDIASVLSRYSSKMQHSTESQVQHNVFFAPRHRLYTPPEYLCIDEGEKGRRQNRDGLERVKAILKARLAHVLLVFKISRLLRVGYKGFQFVNEEVVEEGLRAISTSQGIDTNDEKTWKGLMYLHGMMDDMLLDTIADHCRAGLTSLFLEGYLTGALPVGYESEEVPGAPPTNRGLPRKRPVVNEKVAEMINDHYRWIRDGLPLREGLRRWLADGGPYDPRSTLKHMSYPAYRRMLSNRRYTGLWAFGRKRNRWSSKRDYTMQVEQPETEVKLLRCDELRIVEDDLYFDVQSVLNKKKRGPQGPRKKKQIQLWDLVAENFFCAACSTEKQLVRFHQAGANNRGMRCKRGMHCPCNTTVRRKEAVLAVCSVLAEHVQSDEHLVLGAVDAAVEMDARGDVEVDRQKEQLARQIKTLSAQIDDLYELAGQGTERDRAELKSRIRSAQAQRTTLLGEISRLERRIAGTSTALTPDMARSIVGDMKDLLQRAAAGELGEDSVYRVLSVFRRLVNETIMVHVEPRPARKETNVRGVFRLHLLETVRTESDQTLLPGNSPGPEISVWLREPPQKDQLAPRVHQLIDVEGQAYRGAAKVLQAEGYNINSGVVWQIYRRYYEMIGEPVPKRPYNNGNKRKSA